MIQTHMRTRYSIFGLVGAAAMSLMLVAPVMAADQTIATVIGGAFTISGAPQVAAFEAMPITGVAQTTTARLDAFTVSDLTGRGAGWHVTAEARQFTGSAHDLEAGSLTMSAPTVTATLTDSPAPTVASGPFSLDAGAVEIANAAIDQGMGVYDFSATTLTLSLPVDVYADTYTSTVTISVVAAP